jgi:hypothetical protein
VNLKLKATVGAGGLFLCAWFLFLECRDQKSGIQEPSAMTINHMILRMNRIMERRSSMTPSMFGQRSAGAKELYWIMMWQNMDNLVQNMNQYLVHMNGMLRDSDNVGNPALRNDMLGMQKETGDLIIQIESLFFKMEHIQQEYERQHKSGNDKKAIRPGQPSVI